MSLLEEIEYSKKKEKNREREKTHLGRIVDEVDVVISGRGKRDPVVSSATVRT